MATSKSNPDTATTRHQIYLQRVASYEANTFSDYRARADRIIRDILTDDEIGSLKDLKAVEAEIRDQLGETYSEWTDLIMADMEELAGVEADFSAQMIEKAAEGVDIESPGERVFSAVKSAPVQISTDGQSRNFTAFITGFTAQEVNRVNGLVRNGYYRGMTQMEMVRAIRGTKKNRYKDGIMEISARNAGFIARTATNHTASMSRQATFHKNRDVLDGWRFSATLDARTTTICRRFDGEQFKIGKGPVPPLHGNCRSAMVPVVDKKYSLFKSSGSRASSGAAGGAQTKKSPYYDWLETQPKWFQEKVLGKTKTQLFRESGLSNDEFKRLTTNAMGEPMTIEQMRRENPSAFEDAGLD